MKAMAKWVLVAAGVGLLSYLAAKKITLMAQSGEWTAFTATMVERRYKPSSTTPAYTENYIYARRADGSWVRDVKRQIMQNGGWGDMRVIMDYSSLERTAVDPSTQSLTTTPLSRAAAASLSSPPSTCSTDPNAPHATLLGYDTVRAESTLSGTGPGTTIKVTEWRAAQLQCFPLKETISVQFSKGAGWFHTTREALFVSTGEQSGALFEIPAGYVERTPSEVMAVRAKLFPNEPPTPAKTLKALDEVYQSSRQAQ